jgi:hypothetical protein
MEKEGAKEGAKEELVGEEYEGRERGGKAREDSIPINCDSRNYVPQFLRYFNLIPPNILSILP